MRPYRAGRKLLGPTPGDRVALGEALGISAADSEIIVQAQPHMIVEDVESAYDQTIVSLTPYLRTPVDLWEPGMRLHLLRPNGSVVLRHVGSLSADEQRELLQWMDGSGGESQVVGISSGSLFTAVRTGGFSAQLYYRLNIVRLQLH